VNPLLTSPVREIRTLGSVGAGGGQLPPATRWGISDDRPYRDSNPFLIQIRINERSSRTGLFSAPVFLCRPCERSFRSVARNCAS
jgi:hypothetical protein